jgi:hypothetical protein
MTSLTLVRGDVNYSIVFTVLDAHGDIVDLTNSSIVFKVQQYGHDTLLFEKEGAIVNGTLGICEIPIGDEFKTVSGEFYAELQITWLLENKTLTVPDINIKVLRDLPR